MPYKSTINKGKQEKGKPTESPGRDKASVKDVKKTKEELNKEDELRDQYTDDQGNPDPDKVRVKNPNRNTDKPEIDKPDYGGGSK